MYKVITFNIHMVLGIFSLINAQTHRFIYELKFKSDSTQTEFLKNIMVLDVNPEEIKYYDYAFLEKDSINKKHNTDDTNWTDQIPVVRKKNSNKNMNYVMIDFQPYTFSTEDKIVWSLKQEAKQLNKLNLQKATTEFGGRKWTAWFTKDIPISEGPYKFRGLPGLIVFLHDSEDQYNFSLMKNQNLKETYDTSNFLEVRYGNKPLPITEKIYNAKAIEYFNDPYHDVREGLKNGSIKSYNDNAGVRYTKAEDLIPRTKSEQEYIIKNNNPIELNKAIKYPTRH